MRVRNSSSYYQHASPRENDSSAEKKLSRCPIYGPETPKSRRNPAKTARNATYVTPKRSARGGSYFRVARRDSGGSARNQGLRCGIPPSVFVLPIFVCFTFRIALVSKSLASMRRSAPLLTPNPPRIPPTDLLTGWGFLPRNPQRPASRCVSPKR